MLTSASGVRELHDTPPYFSTPTPTLNTPHPHPEHPLPQPPPPPPPHQIIEELAKALFTSGQATAALDVLEAHVGYYSESTTLTHINMLAQVRGAAGGAFEGLRGCAVIALNVHAHAPLPLTPWL